jgi:hypothetical protein
VKLGVHVFAFRSCHPNLSRDSFYNLPTNFNFRKINLSQLFRGRLQAVKHIEPHVCTAINAISCHQLKDDYRRCSAHICCPTVPQTCEDLGARPQLDHGISGNWMPLKNTCFFSWEPTAF